MFVSHRVTQMPALEAALETHAAVHESLRVHVVRRHNVVSEDRLFLPVIRRKGKLDRPVVTCILSGRARIAAYGRELWLEPGDVAVVDSKASLAMRQEGERFESLVIEWDPTAFGFAPRANIDELRLTRADVDAIRAIASELVALPSEAQELEVARLVCQAAARLRAAGVPFHDLDAEELCAAVPARMRALASALDGTLSDLSHGPASIDLETATGLSARHLNRLVSEFNRRYGFNSEGWRDTRNRWRLFMGGSLMTAPGATSDRVSLAVGYASPGAFSRAFSEAHLPAPSNIARQVRDLL